MKTFVLDTNVALRFLLADDPLQSPKAHALFVLAESGAIKLRLSHIAIAELAWVLSSFFDFARQDIGLKLRGLVLHHGVVVDEPDLILNALDRFARVNADFPDCYAAALASQHAQPVATYDRDFRRFADVVAQTPDEILKASLPRG